MKIAIVTAITRPIAIHTMLYRSVFRIIRNASFVANRNSKFLKPTQGLLKTPTEKLTFLNAIRMPNIGR